jgi:hypothetical protein
MKRIGGTKSPHLSHAAALAASSNTPMARQTMVRAEEFVRSDMTPTPYRAVYRIAPRHETAFARLTRGN